MILSQHRICCVLCGHESLIETFDGIKHALLEIDQQQTGLRKIKDHLFYKMHRFADFLFIHPVTSGMIGHYWSTVRDIINSIAGTVHGLNNFASEHYRWWKYLISAWTDISNMIYRDMFNRLMNETNTKNHPWEYTIYWGRFWYQLSPKDYESESVTETKLRIVENIGFRENIRLFINEVNRVLDSIALVDMDLNITKYERFQFIEDIAIELQIFYYPFCCGDSYKLWVHHRFLQAVDKLKAISAAIVDNTLTKGNMTLQISVGHCLYELEEGFAVALVIFERMAILKELQALRYYIRDYLIYDILEGHWL